MKTPIHGWLNLYKPLEISSAHAVARAKRVLGRPKIGHAGTLDPLADGVLPLAIGEATKAVSLLMNAHKTYRFTIRWGIETTTDDREGEVKSESNKRPLKNNVLGVLHQFTGVISQTPPAYSAIKISGQRAYDLARAGKPVILAAREIHVLSLEYLGEAGDDEASFRVVCGKGTYVRSLARDIAKALGTVGHVSQLTREAVGKFTLENAISLDFLEKSAHTVDALDVGVSTPVWLMPIASVLDDIPAVEVDEQRIRALRHGQSILYPACLSGKVAVLRAGEVAAFATAETAEGGCVLRPERLFNLP